MKNINISDEDFKFLKELQHEMFTQDHVGQASPRFWAIRDYRKIYGVNENYEISGFVIYSNNAAEVIWDSEGDVSLEDFFREELSNMDLNYEDFKTVDVTDEKEVLKALNKQYYEEYEIINYIEEEFIVPNTMFLTNREAKEHLKRNYYHYTKKAYTYAMTAWRSPQVAKLYEILEGSELEGDNE